MFGLGPGFGTQVQVSADVTITNHASAHTKGSYSDLATASAAAFGFTIMWHDSSASGTNSSMLLDIAYNDGSDHIILPNFLVGYAGNRPPCAHFPLTVPSGSVLKARSQGAIGGGTVGVKAWLWQGSPTVAGPWGCSSAIAYGVNTGTSDGTAVAGGQAAKGSWLQIEATSDADHPCIATAVQCNGSTDTGTRLNWAFDVGDGSTVWHSNLIHETDSAEYAMGVWPSIHGIREIDVASGTSLQARAASESTTPTLRTRTVALYGMVAS